MIMEAAEIVLEPPLCVFVVGRIRAFIPILRVKVELEEILDVRGLVFLIAQEAPALNPPRPIRFVCQARADFVCKLRNHLARPVLKSLGFCPIWCHGIRNTCFSFLVDDPLALACRVEHLSSERVARRTSTGHAEVQP